MDENAIPQMAMLAEVKRNGIPLEFIAKVDEHNGLEFAD
jgi:hypothetical protein